MRAARTSFRRGRHLVILAALTPLHHAPAPAAGVAHIDAKPARLSIIRPLELGDTGQRVKDAQWLLSGHNAYRVRTYRGPLDGKFGAETRDATLAIKYQLGYRANQIRPVFGRDLRGILLGSRKLPPLYVVRRASRHPYIKIERSFPLAVRGAWLGYPGQGTHSWTQPPANWESDNAVDVAAVLGTPILAEEDGVICGGFGSLGHSSGRFAGLRFHLCGRDYEWYYAHLSRFARGLHVGARVIAGQTLGYSGIAGVGHLHIACKARTAPESVDGPGLERCDIVTLLKAA